MIDLIDTKVVRLEPPLAPYTIPSFRAWVAGLPSGQGLWKALAGGRDTEVFASETLVDEQTVYLVRSVFLIPASLKTDMERIWRSMVHP